MTLMNPVLGTNVLWASIPLRVHLKEAACSSFCPPLLRSNLLLETTDSPIYSLQLFSFIIALRLPGGAMNPLTRILAGIPCWSELFSCA